ncbi:BTAD domain-containing putative transcriptional regulator [Catenuloplanes japonicus]|uniref:BTAD domain-containing putative transcriptional regulator n=1 Tax=Catenuloplanes japonicus TaxID=33876 RepID=UPI000526AC6E|nr:BTAD domain-containing putative transcriptional regulator [Catenuloplanes japonicus]
MQLSLLGPLSVTIDQREVALGGPKQRLVLALLALRANRAVGVDELMDDLWDEDVPGRPRKTLQVYIAHLRRALDSPHRIVSEPFGYRLSLADDECDLFRFKRLVADAQTAADPDPERAADRYREALGLWSGPALADLRSFPVVERLVHKLDERRAEAAEERLALLLRIGQIAEAIPALIELTETDRCRERPWALLMQAYYQTGRQGDALAIYQRVRDLLLDKLGVEPGPELRRMERTILTQDPRLPVATPVSTAITVADERRPATFISFHLAGYDRLAEDLDLEDLMAEVEAFRERIRAIVDEYGGVVHAVDDGGLLACFGHPVATEDDSRQAVRAGLAAVRPGAASTLAGVRAGVHNGLALFRAGSRTAVFGSTPAVAARLQRAAGQGEVVLSGAVAMMVGPHFTLEANADGTYVVVGEQAPSANGLHCGNLWGRADDLAQVRQAAAADRGLTVLLLWGEAGIGKTALAGAALDQLGDRYPAASVVILRGDRHRRGQALHPVAAALAACYRDADQFLLELQLAGVTGDDAAHLLGMLGELAGWADCPEPRQRTGGARRRAVLTWLSACAGDRPVCLVVEDLHDVDQETRDLLDEVADEVGGGILLITSRTDDLPPRLAATARRVRLGRLPSADARALVVQTAGARRLRTATVNEIVRRCDGHPLHLRELTLATVAAGPEALEVTGDLPTPLHASLQARLDSLGPAKALAQRCAAVRGPFDRELVALLCDERHLGDRDPALLEQDLTELVSAGVLRRASGHREGCFVFSHALLEDCAYATLPRGVRAELHRRIAAWMRSSGSAEPGRLAEHLTASGDIAGAVQLWMKASDEASKATRYVDAVRYARQALRLIPQLPATPERDATTLLANIVLAHSMAVTGAADVEVYTSALRARRLAVTLGRTEILGAIDALIIFGLQGIGRYETAARHGSRVLAAPEASGGLYEAVRVYHSRTLFWLGRLAEAEEVAVTSARLAAVDATSYFGTAVVKLVQCANLTLAGLAAFTEDRGEHSDHLFRQADVIARRAGALDAVCITDLTYAITRQLAGDVPTTHRLAESALEIAVEIGSDGWFVWSQMLLGWAVSVGGNPEEGLAMMAEAINHSGKSQRHLPYFGALAATGILAAGRPAEALERAVAAVELAERIGERLLLPYIHHVVSDAQLANGLPAAAEDHRRRAHALAELQGQWWFVRNLPAPGTSAIS